MGAEGVRNRLKEINSELKAGKPVTKELKEEIRELGTQVNTQTRVVRLNEQAWRQSHSTLSTAAKIMSSVGSIARGALAVTTAWSIASVAFGRTSSQLVEVRAEIERTTAQLADAVKRGADQQTISELQERLNVLKAQQEELASEEFQSRITNVINLVSTLAIGFGGATQMLTKLGPQLSAFKAGLLGVGPAGAIGAAGARTFGAALRSIWAALGPIGLIIIGLSIAIPLLIEHWDEITAAFQSSLSWLDSTFRPVFESIWTSIQETLTTVWSGIQTGFLAFWNGMIGLVNAGGQALVDGINTAVSAVISAVNAIIEAINRAAEWTGIKLPKVGFSPLAFTAIPTISAATGFSGKLDRDTHFLAHRGEFVNVTPASQVSRGGGSTPSITVNVYGDVSGEELVDKVRMAIKENLKQLGFTGF
ncbi:hypothetical protein [Nitrososphaera sp.]|uniref:hypothetical protein n=1 Tax=Nitrososphaera sp. TaxID=1971748 RepID=UPI00183F36B5|nr:hypothetical protein [Nitrososphaera sp.]NWG36009.1 hypothetical protein [Nitrososphaera sp.]